MPCIPLEINLMFSASNENIWSLFYGTSISVVYSVRNWNLVLSLSTPVYGIALRFVLTELDMDEKVKGHYEGFHMVWSREMVYGENNRVRKDGRCLNAVRVYFGVQIFFKGEGSVLHSTSHTFFPYKNFSEHLIHIRYWEEPSVLVLDIGWKITQLLFHTIQSYAYSILNNRIPLQQDLLLIDSL